MNKNTVHNFNILIKNNSPLESSEDLTKSFIKELAQVSKEINEQKDIIQIWQEQNASNNVMNNTLDSAGEGVFDTNAAIKTVPSFSNTSSASGSNLFTGSTLNASIGGGAFDSTESTSMSSFGSTGNTLPVSEAENIVLDSAFSQIYESIDAKQMLTVPQMLQSNSNEPSMELIKAEIKKKLDLAIKENNPEAIQYWTRISKAFDDEKTAVADFVDKPNEMLFTEMYNALKQLTATSAEVQNFNWNVVREKMIKAIDANILKGSISKAAKNRWETIKKQLADDKTNVANLFERYDELFLLLKEVEGLDALPNSITITTKTKIYPNLSADKLYASIGKEDVYVFLKQVNETDLDGSAVNKGAVKIKNANATSFIVGESLEFFVDEAFINQKVNQKENINWIVYNSKTGNDNIFENEGTSFSYNFDTPGTYRIDAYGKNHTVKQKKSAATATFIELKIVAQDIIITPPAIAKAEFIRPFAEEKTFKVSLKNMAIKTLNPMKLYYQIENVVGGKNAVISEERELDSTGIIKLAMPDLGIYKIKVASKDQYGLNKEFKTSVIKNEVISIGHVKDTPNKNVFLLGNSSNALTLEAKTFKINPPTDTEKKDVKWIIHDSNNKLYVPDGEVIINENKNPQKPYIHKWDFYDVAIPQKIGFYKIEAYCNDKKGPKDGVTFKMEVKQPEITEAYWAWSGGSKKTISGLLESNWINASIPHYNNQTVRIYFYLSNAKTNYYIDVKTNSKGEIFEEVKFDATFQKAIGLGSKKNAKIGFKLLGVQNSKPYPFNSPANYDANTTLSLTTDKKVLDVYFNYDGIRVNPLTLVPYGAKVKGIVKTLNMVGSEVVLKVRRKNVQHSQLKIKTIVKSEGEASISFVLDKKWRPITPLFGTEDSYYLGMEGVESRLYLENGLNAVVGDFNNIANKKEIIDENDPELIWGAKVSKDFRIKVVQICKELWPNNILEMANGLMAVMNRETAGTFAPHQIEGKKLIPKDQVTKDSFNKYKDGKRLSRAVGLVQFTQSALSQMGEYKGGGFDELHELKLKYAKMTQLDQLNKVKKYIESVKTLPKIPEDIYIAVFAPAFVGNDLNETMYELGTTNYNENASLDVDKKKNGIQMRELITEYYNSLHDGEYARNVWRNPLDKMELRGWYKSGWRLNESNYLLETKIRNKGKHLGLDLYAPIGTPVYACVDGTVLILRPDYSQTFGLHVRIEGYYKEKKYNFFYAHLSKIAVKNFQKVKAGTLLGYTGQTGEAEGQPTAFNHLHFEVRNSRENRGATLNPLEEIGDLKNNVNMNPAKETQK